MTRFTLAFGLDGGNTMGSVWPGRSTHYIARGANRVTESDMSSGETGATEGTEAAWEGLRLVYGGVSRDIIHGQGKLHSIAYTQLFKNC